MKIIYDHYEFWELTDPQMEFDLDQSGIKPDTEMGFFFRQRYDELLDFCKKQPEYHVISVWGIDGFTVNGPIPDAGFYMLGKGDANRDLIYVAPRNERTTIGSHLLKF